MIALADEPLPAATPELLLLIAMMESFRRLYGVDWCQHNLVGPMRDSLGRSFPENVLEMRISRTPEMVAYMAAQHSAADLLDRMCAACGGCELAQRVTR
jgi:hypothetical protein